MVLSGNKVKSRSVGQPYHKNYSIHQSRYVTVKKSVIIVSATRKSRGIKISLCLSEKFNTVSNEHGRTQKCNFCVSFDKTSFTDHHTPDTINGFKDSILVCKMHGSNCTIRKNFRHFHSFPSGLLIKRR